MKNGNHDQAEHKKGQDRKGAQVLGQMSFDQFHDIGKPGNVDGKILGFQNVLEMFNFGDKQRPVSGMRLVKDDQHI